MSQLDIMLRDMDHDECVRALVRWTVGWIPHLILAFVYGWVIAWGWDVLSDRHSPVMIVMFLLAVLLGTSLVWEDILSRKGEF